MSEGEYGDGKEQKVHRRWREEQRRVEGKPWEMGGGVGGSYGSSSATIHPTVSLLILNLS